MDRKKWEGSKNRYYDFSAETRALELIERRKTLIDSVHVTRRLIVTASSALNAREVFFNTFAAETGRQQIIRRHINGDPADFFRR